MKILTSLSAFFGLLQIYFVLVAAPTAYGIGSSDTSSLEGDWLFERTSIFSDSAFAAYYSTNLKVTATHWQELEIFGLNHRVYEYSWTMDGNHLRMRDGVGRERHRYFELMGDSLRVCLHADLSSCDEFKRGAGREFRQGQHDIPEVRATIVWTIDGRSVVQELGSAEVAALFSSTYAETSPQWTRILHPIENNLASIYYGLTILTGLIDSEERHLGSYRGTLTLWAGIPSGTSYYVVPFAAQKSATALTKEIPWSLAGRHGDREFQVELTFHELH